MAGPAQDSEHQGRQASKLLAFASCSPKCSGSPFAALPSRLVLAPALLLQPGGLVQHHGAHAVLVRHHLVLKCTQATSVGLA